MKYIIDLPEEFAEATQEYWEKTVGMQLEPYAESSRKAIEDEVWEFLDFLFTGMSPEERYECFDKVFSHIIVSTMSYQEAKAKYEAWLKQKDEIHVGDEVTSKFGDGVVIDIVADESVHILGKDGHWNEYAEGEYRKTGRHFAEVAELLEKMRGEEGGQ